MEFPERGELKHLWVNYVSSTQTFNRIRLKDDPEKQIRPENCIDVLYYYESKVTN